MTLMNFLEVAELLLNFPSRILNYCIRDIFDAIAKCFLIS